MFEDLSEEQILNMPLDSFNTHRPFLKQFIENTDGNIIEFGTGYGSTPFILNLIKGTNRKLISFENDLEWLNEIKTRYPESDNHKYFFSENWETDIPMLAKILSMTFHIDICFIDSKPWESRVLAMNCFKNISKYVMIHDVDYFPSNGIFGHIEIFKKNVVDETLGIFSHEFKYIFPDISDYWKLYYPPSPWPVETGPPTLIFCMKEEHSKIFQEQEKQQEKLNWIIN
jgi:hypothetical protein